MVFRVMKWSLFAVMVLVLNAAVAQEDGPPLEASVSIQSDPSTASNVPLAVSQVLLINLAVNRFDAGLLDKRWARVDASDWRKNFRDGWVWDENSFAGNTFSHPFHGSMYFNAGRANGLDYWESVPLTLFGSWTWEYFGETEQPSLNDFFMTSFGGVAIGEVFYRVGSSIRDNEATGAQRLLREVAAMPFDPIGGLNRFVRGQWASVGPNPVEHSPKSFILRVGAGPRVVADSGFIDAKNTYSPSTTVEADLQYGDPFGTRFTAPFDVFSVRLQVSPGGGGGLNEVQASGRLFATNLRSKRTGHRHGFAINQRFDFLNNSAQRFSAQSIELGFYSRWRVGRKSGIRTQLFVDGILLGAVDAPFAGVGKREYDFGPGVGYRIACIYERRGLRYVTMYFRSELVHTVSGAAANHNLNFGGIDINIPIAFNLGLGLNTGYYRRTSYYKDRPNEVRDFPQSLLLLTWTGSALPWK